MPAASDHPTDRPALLHVDGAAGIAGDMMLGALVDLGVPASTLVEALRTLDLPGWSLEARRVVARGLAATRVHVRTDEDAGGDLGHVHVDEHGDVHGAHGHDHGHHDAHDHDHAHGRGFADLARVIDRSRLSERVKSRALEIFRRLCEAESRVHGVPFDEVHLHEAGAVDALVDACGTCVGLEHLGWPELSCSPPELGSGSITCRHGVVPVPAPATVALLAGRPVRSSRVEAELTTPTGAAILVALSSRWGAAPDMVVDRVGYGAGSRTLPDRANVVRLTLGHAPSGGAEPRPADEHVVVEADVDDADPQLLAAFADRARALGAGDVTLAPLAMKKGRPGTRVTVVAPSSARERLVDALFEETTTIGCRWHVVRREECERTMETATTPWGPVRVKVARWKGRVVNTKPEHDDCAAIAARAGVPLKQVVAAAAAASEPRA